MLHGVHPLLPGELLAALDRLGHGEEFVVADANFPAYGVGVIVVELPGIGAPELVHAIRTVIPLDTYEGASFLLMTSEDTERPPVQHELIAAAQSDAGRVESLERFAFYERAANAKLVVRSGERRAYGNCIIRKGVVNAGDCWTLAP